MEIRLTTTIYEKIKRDNRMKKGKSSYSSATKDGMLQVMNSPANPMTKEGLEAFREMKKASGMNTTEMFNYIGRKSRFPRGVDADKKKQEARLEKLSPNE